MHIDINILQFLFILYFMGKLYVLMILFVLVIKLPGKAIKGYKTLSCKIFFKEHGILQDSLNVPLFTVLF